MRTFGTEIDLVIDNELRKGMNQYNMILYQNGNKLDIYIKKMTIHFLTAAVPYGNVTKYYFELETDYMDFLEQDEVKVEIEKNGVSVEVSTFYIKSFKKGEAISTYVAYTSLVEPEKIRLYKIDEERPWRVDWNTGAKTIREILDTFLTPIGMSMSEYPTYTGTFVSYYADWENMSLAQLISACGILEGCNYVLIGNVFHPIRPSTSSSFKSYKISETVYKDNFYQQRSDAKCGIMDIGYKRWAYEDSTSEDPMLGFQVSFTSMLCHWERTSRGTGKFRTDFPLIPAEHSKKLFDHFADKLSCYFGFDMNVYSVSYLGDVLLEPGDRVCFYSNDKSAFFYPSELIWEWDGGLKCTAKSEAVQKSGTSDATVSLQELANTLYTLSTTLQNVRYNSVTTKTLEADSATIGLLKVEQADVKYATIQSLNATDAKITALDSATIKTDELYSKVADLDYIKSDHADIAVIKNTMITTDTLKTEIAKIGYLTTDEADIRYLTVSTADTKYLHADMSDMDIAKIQTLFATAGIVSDMTIKDGHITGVLDSVTVNANSITTGTLSVDRLVIRGSEKSLVYELNNISGALQAKSVDTLNGEILTQRTITADKLVAKSITSNEIKTGTITSDEIKTGTITAANINMIDLVGDSAFINSLKTNTVIVGLQNDINGISVGGRNLIIQKSLTNGHINKYSGVYVAQSGGGNWTTGNISVRGYNQVTVSFYENHSDVTVGSYIHQFTSDGVHVRSDSCDLRSPGSITIPIASNTAIIRATLAYCNTLKWKLEKGNRATDWTPAPEDVDDLISAAQSTANSANSLASTANGTANSALTGLNNLEIGGNNLLRNSADLTKWNKETGVTVTKQNDGYFYIKETDTSKPGRWGIYQDIAVQQNTDYTMAVDGRTNVCFSMALGTTYTFGSGTDVSNEKTTKRYVYKFNTGSNTCLRVYLHDQGNAGVYLKCPKLEKGNKATDWTMAIEDWCYNNDITYINGGKIYTGTVTADKIAANSITADKLSVDAITSRNYVKDVAGTKISLSDGSYDSKYTKINSEGKIECSNIKITDGDIELTASSYDLGKLTVKHGNGKLVLKSGETTITTDRMSTYYGYSGLSIAYWSEDKKTQYSIDLTVPLADSGGDNPFLLLSSLVGSKRYSTTIYPSGVFTPKLNADEISLNGVSLASSLAGLADDKVLKSNRGWYPNGKNMNAVPPGVYSTNPGAVPNSLGGLNTYGTLLILRENSYQTAIYMSVTGQLAIWASNVNAWSVIKS